MRNFPSKQGRRPPSTSEVLGFVRPNGEPPKKRGVRGVNDEKFLDQLEEFERLVASDRIAEATPMHFVALYADLHARVYQAPPVDLGPKERVFAARLAKDLLEKDFGGSPHALAEFLAWTWTREKGRVKWRAENGREQSRISWRLQFGRSLLADYRVAKATAAKNKEAR